MRKVQGALGMFVVLLASTASAAPPAGGREPHAQVLPLRNAVFYESGVGYFERRGDVLRGEALGLLVPENHLDDALMTLVVLTADGARVGAVTFPSVLAPEAALAEAPASLDGFASDGPISPLLSALAGLEAVLTTTDGERIEGRVVGMARVDRLAAPEVDLQSEVALSTEHPTTAPGTIPAPALVFATDDGAFRWFDLDEIESVGPASEPAQEAMDRAVAALSQRRGEELATLGINVREGGDLGIGYLAEASVWRVSYRIVFRGDAAHIQGWALVHNDTDEDWERIAVEFVEGRPASYLFPFATPRFRPRDVVPAPDDLQTAPQLAGTNVDALAAQGLWGYGSGGGYGYGSGRGGLGMYGTGMGGGGSYAEEASPLIDFGADAAETLADPEQRRELLAYRGTEPLSLDAHESALVPVLDDPVSAERVSLVMENSDAVLAALKLTNDTGLSLKEGPLAVFDSGFVGQTWIPRMHTSESRMLPHGTDLDVVAEWISDDATNQTRVVRWNPLLERLEEHYVRRATNHWTLTSHASGDRAIYLRMRPLTNGRVIAEDRVERLLDVDGGETDYVRIALPAGEVVERDVTTEEGLMADWLPSAVDIQTLERLAGCDAVDAGTRSVLLEAAASIRESQRCEGEMAKRNVHAMDLINESERLRLDLAALAGANADPDIATEIAERLLENGRELERTHDDSARLAAEADAARARVAVILARL